MGSTANTDEYLTEDSAVAVLVANLGKIAAEGVMARKRTLMQEIAEIVPRRVTTHAAHDETPLDPNEGV